MGSLSEASLSDEELRVVERFIESLRREFKDSLRGVWLYGSRARAEEVGSESDVDLLIITDGGMHADQARVDELAWEAATSEGANPFGFSTQVRDPGWLEGRRAINSFFMQEVDRDKIVLAGEP